MDTPHFSEGYLALRITYLRNEIKKLPSGYYVYHHGSDYIRTIEMVDGKRKVTERSINTKEGKRLSKLISYRAELKDKLKKIMGEWNKYYGGKVPEVYYHKNNIPLHPCMTINFYDQAEACTNSIENNKGYELNNINMRSRFELVSGVIVDNLYLDFKYEVTINLMGNRYSIDILIALPEKGRCIAIELAGLFGDVGYQIKNMRKQSDFITAGLIPNRDFFVIWGGENWLPSDNDIKRIIIAAVENA